MQAQVRWFTLPITPMAGRERSYMAIPTRAGREIDRVKIPAGKHVAAHTHTQDELVTIIDGTWYVGVGDKYDPAMLEGYPAGSFALIPAGLLHFVAAKETAVIVQLSGADAYAA
jgi:quercetin dioxygenase-like cupin family protein